MVAAATGKPLADYCAEMIWGPAGMEADAYWALEAEDGQELGGAGVNARLRDFARFGQFVLEHGVAADGHRVLPPPLAAISPVSPTPRPQPSAS